MERVSRLKIGMQSNLMLFNEEIAEFMLREGMTVGVSLDGPPETNDIFRVDRRGRGTGARVEKKLDLSLSPRFRRLFSGFLCVVNLDADPETVVDYLLSFEPHSIDFLLPLYNHDTMPLRHRLGYGEWLVRCFDRWLSSGTKTRICYFNSIIQMMCGKESSVELIGLLPVGHHCGRDQW